MVCLATWIEQILISVTVYLNNVQSFNVMCFLKTALNGRGNGSEYIRKYILLLNFQHFIF